MTNAHSSSCCFRVEEAAVARRLGLVLARGGSKGLPRKNLALVNNRTLLARALTAMQLSRCESPTCAGLTTFSLEVITLQAEILCSKIKG